ncbi:MAG: class I SAM-dependent methyltransferase [Thermostichales cyanobacterium BF3_bins_165]
MRRLIPDSVVSNYRKVKRWIESRQNTHKSTEQVFTEIYEKNKWGGNKGEFCSGSGSVDEQLVSSYVSVIREKGLAEGFLGLTFVDLGCGDFRVGQRLIPLCSRYIGVDIVEPLINENRDKYGNSNIEFLKLDIIQDQLPDGDVCFVRQVLQHLSNQQIVTILDKIRKYPWVFITEHYPSDNQAIYPNKDKVHGGDIRLYDNSGVYLTEPPFAIPRQHLEMVLEVPGTPLGGKVDPGVIRTFLYKPAGSLTC